jgi:hypothetical protein
VVIRFLGWCLAIWIGWKVIVPLFLVVLLALCQPTPTPVPQFKREPYTEDNRPRAKVYPPQNDRIPRESWDRTKPRKDLTDQTRTEAFDPALDRR